MTVSFGNSPLFWELFGKMMHKTAVSCIQYLSEISYTLLHSTVLIHTAIFWFWRKPCSPEVEAYFVVFWLKIDCLWTTYKRKFRPFSSFVSIRFCPDAKSQSKTYCPIYENYLWGSGTKSRLRDNFILVAVYIIDLWTFFLIMYKVN